MATEITSAPTVEITDYMAASLMDRAADHVAVHGWIQRAHTDGSYEDITKCRTCAAAAIEVVGGYLIPGLSEVERTALIDTAQALFADWLAGRGTRRAYSAERLIINWNDRPHRRKRHVVRSLRMCAAATRGGTS